MWSCGRLVSKVILVVVLLWAPLTDIRVASAENPDVRTAGEAAKQVETVIQRDILQLHSAPHAFLADSAYPVVETREFPFVRFDTTPPLNSRTRFSPVPGTTISGYVGGKFQNRERASLGVEFKAADGSRAIAHFDYRRDGTFDSGVILSKGEHLAYLLTRTPAGLVRVEAMERERLIPVEPNYIGQAPSAAGSPLNISNTDGIPALESLPGAPNVLYLDLDGHITEGTWINSEFTRFRPIVSAPTPLNLISVEYVWKRVSEMYRAFNINVTTIQDRFDKAPPTQRMRVVITPSDFLGGGAGIAQMESWGINNGNTPCFVFIYKAPTNFSQVVVVTHEAGHTMSLDHDGRRLSNRGTEVYFSGHVEWGPLMGAPYERRVPQWSEGEYLGANNGEDDLSKIASVPGISRRSDLVGNFTFTATTLVPQLGKVSYEGIIESREDKDVFRFTTGKTTLSPQVISAFPGWTGRGMLNIAAKIYDQKGIVVAVSDPKSEPGDTKLDAIFSPIPVDGGTYFIEVDGVGEFDPLTTGFSDYSSIGSYSLSVGGLVPFVATKTPTATPTLTPTRTRTPVSTPTPTRTPTTTPTVRATLTPTRTATVTRTPPEAPTQPPTSTPSATPTSKPPTLAPTTTPSATPTSPGSGPGPVITKVPIVGR